jgi:hypothetical protein
MLLNRPKHTVFSAFTFRPTSNEESHYLQLTNQRQQHKPDVDESHYIAILPASLRPSKAKLYSNCDKTSSRSDTSEQQIYQIFTYKFLLALNTTVVNKLSYLHT